MKNLALILSLFVAMSANAESQSLEEHQATYGVAIEDPIDAANIMNQNAVRDCMDKVSKKGLSPKIAVFNKKVMEDLNEYIIGGELVGIDTIDGSFQLKVSESFNLPPFGTTGYSCEVTHYQEF